MRYLAPVGTPISLSDLKNWLSNLVLQHDIHEEFGNSICSKYHVKNCFFVSSGRAALYLLLKTFYGMAGGIRNEVIITSYNSCSVLSSITKAGLKIRICDIDANTLDYDYRKLSGIDFTKVLCIVTSNLYGFPNDLTKLSQIAKANGVFLIDDAAQCMGGQIDGKYSGTFGDAGIYSLGKGKNITSVEGGIIVTNSDDIALSIGPQITSLPKMSMLQGISCALQLLMYSAFLHPNLCMIPANISSLSAEHYIPEFPVNSYSKLLGSIGLHLFQKIGMIENARIKNSGYYREHLKYKTELNLIKYSDGVRPVFLRFPLLIKNSAVRNRIVRDLNKEGIWTTKAYPLSVMDIQEIEGVRIGSDSDAEAGRMVAEQLVTLPTHPYVTGNDLKKIIEIIRLAIEHRVL